MEGTREALRSRDGTEIGVVSAGSGTPLLLVHGGMTSSTRWQPLWPFLTAHHRVTAMDRRGRGGSGDHGSYALGREYDDVVAVADRLAAEHGAPVDVFGHSIGAVCVLGAAARGAPFRRIALHEPPGPETVTRDWVHRVTEQIAAGDTGRAVGSFLIEVIGLAPETVMAMRDSPVAAESVGIAEATMVREAMALSTVDLDDLAARADQPVLLLLGSESPAWAHAITERLGIVLPDAELTVLDGVGHEAVDTAPDAVSREVLRFLSG